MAYRRVESRLETVRYGKLGWSSRDTSAFGQYRYLRPTTEDEYNRLLAEGEKATLDRILYLKNETSPDKVKVCLEETLQNVIREYSLAAKILRKRIHEAKWGASVKDGGKYSGTWAKTLGEVEEMEEMFVDSVKAIEEELADPVGQERRRRRREEILGRSVMVPARGQGGRDRGGGRGGGGHGRGGGGGQGQGIR